MSFAPKAVWSVAGLALLLLVGTAEAGPNNLNQLLRGDYAFSGAGTCLVQRDSVNLSTIPPTPAPAGFNPNLTPFGPPAAFPTVFSFSIQGVRTFNGDGTGTVVARAVFINHPFALPTSPLPVFNRGGAGSTDIQSTFTYEVAPDRTFTIETPVVNLTSVAPAAGQTSTITDLPVFSGSISQDHRTLTVQHDEPGVETLTPSVGPVQKRICVRSRILLELQGGN